MSGNVLTRKLWHTIAGTSGAKFYSMGLNIVALALTARWLGPDGRGAFATASAWLNTLALLASLSLGQVAVQRLAGCRDSQRFGEVFGTLAWLTGGLSVLGWLGVALAWWLGGVRVFGDLPLDMLMLALVGLPFLLWEGYSNALLAAVERLRTFNLALMSGRTLMLVLLVGSLAGLDGGVGAAVVVMGVSQMWIALSCLPTLNRVAQQHGHRCWQGHEARALLQGGLRLHLNTVGTLALNMAGTLLVAGMVGTREAGFFQLAQQLSSVLLVIPQSAALVLYGRQGQLGADGVWPLQRKMTLAVVALTALGAGGMAVSAPYWLPWVAGDGFAPVVELFVLLVPAVALQSFASMMAPQWIGRGLFLTASVITVAVGGVNLACANWWIPQYGIRGAVYALLAALVAGFCTNLAMAAYCEKRAHQKVN